MSGDKRAMAPRATCSGKKQRNNLKNKQIGTVTECVKAFPMANDRTNSARK